MLGKIMMNVYIVAKDSRLSNWLRIVDNSHKFRIMRLRQLNTACERAVQNSDSIILVDWESKDVAKGIEELSIVDRFREIGSRFFICVNDMMLLSPTDSEFIRLAILQIGVGGVFSRLGELAQLMPTFIRYWQNFNLKAQPSFSSTWDLLPWKKYAVRPEF
ncbi:MAG: hypothetical protein LBB88_06855 [Planctomycetaceae bacterium]|jgi:hypothetical protein|nr:hypothetical protein [Planctomycetaceae bacterium]